MKGGDDWSKKDILEEYTYSYGAADICDVNIRRHLVKINEVLLLDSKSEVCYSLGDGYCSIRRSGVKAKEVFFPSVYNCQAVIAREIESDRYFFLHIHPRSMDGDQYSRAYASLAPEKLYKNLKDKTGLKGLSGKIELLVVDPNGNMNEALLKKTLGENLLSFKKINCPKANVKVMDDEEKWAVNIVLNLETNQLAVFQRGSKFFEVHNDVFSKGQHSAKVLAERVGDLPKKRDSSSDSNNSNIIIKSDNSGKGCCNII